MNFCKLFASLDDFSWDRERKSSFDRKVMCMIKDHTSMQNGFFSQNKFCQAIFMLDARSCFHGNMICGHKTLQVYNLALVYYHKKIHLSLHIFLLFAIKGYSTHHHHYQHHRFRKMMTFSFMYSSHEAKLSFTWRIMRWKWWKMSQMKRFMASICAYLNAKLLLKLSTNKFSLFAILV